MELFLTDRKRIKTPDAFSFTPSDMPIDTALRGLDLTETNPEKGVRILGNEPLLYPELEQLLASCRKRGLKVDIETTGLCSSGACRLLCESGFNVTIKLYRPEYYTEQDLAELDENIQRFKDAGLKIKVVPYVDDVSADYTFVLDFLHAHEIYSCIFRLSCRLKPAEMRPFITWIMSVEEENARQGYALMFDCGIHPCAFTDAEYGFLCKMGFNLTACSPHDGIMPDGRTCHCREMVHLPGRPVTVFKRESEILKYYYEVFLDLQWQIERCEGCSTCLTRLGNACMGYTNSAKSMLVIADYEKLKDEFRRESESETPIWSEEERAAKLWELGCICFMLAYNADAIECFEEFRALRPEFGRVHLLLGRLYWEVGRPSDGEEEFRKASRLMDDPIPALKNLYERLKENGNAIRARLLQGEIEKLTAQRGKQQKG